jgi:acetyl-CoA carboxylase carboxyltransferase component
MAVMEGDSAVMAIFAERLEKLKTQGKQPDEELKAQMDKVRSDYEHQLDAKYAAARGFVDAVIAPEDIRRVLEMAFKTSLNNAGPHLGQYTLPNTFA